MSATQADIVLFRNEQREFSGQCVDELGEPIDITSTVFASSAKSQAGDADVIAEAAFTKGTPSLGVFSFIWDGADFDGYGSAFSETRLSYDMKIDNDNILYGQIILKPGATA